MSLRNPILAVAAALLVFAGLAPNAADDDPNLAPEDYGLEGNLLYVSAEDFTLSDVTGSMIFRRCHSANYWCASGDVLVYASVRLPAGALVTGLRVFYMDDDDTGSFDLQVELLRSYHWSAIRGMQQLAAWSSFGDPGVEDEYVDVDPDVTVQYRWYNGLDFVYQSYVLQAHLPGTSEVQLRGIAVYWHRQVSPAPASATFSDVPTGHWAFQHIEALAASGITVGCGGGMYCPDTPLTRAEMAVFLAKGLGLHWVT